MRSVIAIAASFVFVAILGIAGCGSEEGSEQNLVVEISGLPPALAGGHDHSHAHGDTGPHGGHLIELGRNHKFHAELVENEAAETVTVYILDTHMQELAIRAASIRLNLTTIGQGTSYEMTAVRDGDGQGDDYSRFESADPSLFQALVQSGEVSGKLHVTIEGVPYIGLLAHHDHSHDHSTHRH